MTSVGPALNPTLLDRLHLPAFAVTTPLSGLGYGIEPVAVPRQGDQTVEIEPDIVITAKDPEFDPIRGISYFRGGVKVVYGDTVLTADTLVVRVATKNPEIDDKPIEIPELGITLRVNEGYATGTVRIDDPEAKIQARNIRLSWNKESRNSRLESASIEIGALRLKADVLEQTVAGWQLSNVEMTTCRNEPPFYRLKLRSALVVPGKRVTARGIRLAIFGQTLPTFPSFSASLDRRTTGLTIPKLADRKDDQRIQECLTYNPTSILCFKAPARLNVECTFGTTIGPR